MEVPLADRQDRATALLRQAEAALGEVDVPPEGGPSRQEAAALARGYLEAGWREWEAQHWGSATLFADLALQWVARATERGSQSSKEKPAG